VNILLQNRSTDGRCPEIVISVKKSEALGKKISYVTTEMREHLLDTLSWLKLSGQFYQHGD
jgi:hypothetical protein